MIDAMHAMGNLYTITIAVILFFVVVSVSRRALGQTDIVRLAPGKLHRGDRT